MIVHISRDEIVATFTEWERRYREEPEAFMSDAERLADDEATYGETATSTFLEYLGRVRA